jgi:hypothetical protein
MLQTSLAKYYNPILFGTHIRLQRLMHNVTYGIDVFTTARLCLMAFPTVFPRGVLSVVAWTLKGTVPSITRAAALRYGLRLVRRSCRVPNSYLQLHRSLYGTEIGGGLRILG